SRTVAWFTSIYPVRVDPGPTDYADITTGGPTAGQTIKHIKEQLRRTPGDGLGYGLLRYLNPTTATELAPLTTPPIGFNYMGRFTTSASADASPVEWEPIGLGGDGGAMPASHVLETGGVVRENADGPQRTIMLSWPAELLDEPDVEQLAESWAAVLTGLTQHVARPDAGGHTPSDFPLLNLAQRELDVLQAELARGTEGRGSR